MSAVVPRGVFERPKGSGEWWVRYHDEQGREHREKVGPKGLAIKVYQKRKTEIAERRFFPERFQQRDEPLAHAFAAYIKRRTDLDLSWASVSKWWLAQPEMKQRLVREFSPDDAEAAQTRTIEAGRSPSTWNNRRVLLHAFYEDYEARRRRQPHAEAAPPIANPLKGFRLTEDNARVRYLTDDEEARLRAALPDTVKWTIVLTAMHSGARCGNVFALRWPSDVNFTSRMLRTWSRKGRKKVLREHWVPINDELHRALVGLPSRGRSEWLFPNAQGTGPLDAKNWYHRVWQPALRAAKITNFRFHDLRHTTASRLRQQGVPIEDIAEVLGHADTRMTQRYAHIAPGSRT